MRDSQRCTPRSELSVCPIELPDAGIDIIADSWAAVADAPRLIEINLTVKRVNNMSNTASLSVLSTPAQS
jgi:hypothetical protein